MLPLDPIVVTIILLLVGIAASFVPLIPGGALSTLGVAYYWMVTGEIGTIAFLGFVILGVFTVVFDLLESALSARIGGASIRTTIIAAIAAIGLLFVLGPLGALLGVVGAVFFLEYLRHGDVRRGGRTAAVTAIGMLASTAIQVLLTVSMLAGFLVFLWI
ncbi:DUF456 domain-containing protein [Natronomonas sp. F2-12]|jgi:uncharacterized protein YqgC (DUF456 family)|uniref:DUF456 domain-containing protein n=1 Tax=Natronomonas aquatica TaxID=2841590 RepID=A0A9R1CUG4_9EURY|nr:DUF456 domain-containing protein [Natronomonas aquatica]MCQ4334260.1 DUF456 domain-containing protein [Natronomonas aquatica]